MDKLNSTEFQVVDLSNDEILLIDGGDRITRAVFEAAGYFWEGCKDFKDSVQAGMNSWHTYSSAGGTR